MNPKTIQACARLGGLIFGACGVASIVACFVISKALPPPLPDSVAAPTWPFILSLLLLAAGFFRAAYLAWFRWSPLAIRHAVSGVFFFVTLFGLVYLPFHVPTGWGIFTFLAAFPVCYVAHLIVAHALIRCAFPPSPVPPSPATPPPLPRQAAGS